MSFVNQVLIVGLDGSGQSTLVKDLFGRGHHESHDGSVHKAIGLVTKYYSSEIDIWTDAYEKGSFDQWANEFLSEEAKPMRESLNGIIFTFDFEEELGEIDQVIGHLERITESLDELSGEEDYNGWSGFKAAVVSGIPEQSEFEGYDDLEYRFQLAGFELVNYACSARNEFGEKVGKERLREIFETCEWTQMESGSKDDSEEVSGEDIGQKPEDLDKVFQMALAARTQAAQVTNKEEKEKLVNAKLTEIMNIL
ncbi:unnamed protein product [Kuraishia capsulata CBS 1993]|uniref:Increased recombination centers protein 6 n=1 Tax=Kuraishia capsulata CBS 1993 TaxID=1382522 RepID=W6MVC1_9ASCO|nr:uncharacterized protein KUCA_T00005871001 [Kuraishia capsulata CBS 1993]CDK29877.1 unnamed protein product [Kuraishia capsulata CBS 1993]